MKMKAITIAALTTLAFASGVKAGQTTDAPVVINMEGMSAQGAQTSARFSENDVERIGCGARVTDAGVGDVVYFGFCQATDANEVSVTCFTFSPDLVAAINSVANFGFIDFSWNENDECTSVRNSTQSIYLPDFGNGKKKK